MSQKSKSLGLITLLALAAYLLPAFMVSRAHPDRVTALTIAVLATGLFCILMRNSKKTQGLKCSSWSARLIAGRLIFTAVLVLAVTGVADIVGPGWAGLFSAFPVALYPLVFLLHREYGAGVAQTVLGNFPFGLWSVIAYALTVSLVYPTHGVVVGTLIGFAVATVVLLGMGLKPLITHRKGLGQDLT